MERIEGMYIGDTAIRLQKAYSYAKAVVDTVDVPVSVKINASLGNLSDVVSAAESAGVNGISAIDTLRSILDIDVETGIPCLPTYGGYSGAPIRPVALATVAGIAQSTSLPIIGIGGIENHKNLLEHIMAGAVAGGLGTAILLNGYGIVEKIKDQLDSWLRTHNMVKIEDLQGMTLKHLKPFEEIKREEKSAHLTHGCERSDCDRCIECCMDRAFIRKEKELYIDEKKCSGCGLCLDVCPERKIKLTWKHD